MLQPPNLKCKLCTWLKIFAVGSLRRKEKSLAFCFQWIMALCVRLIAGDTHFFFVFTGVSIYWSEIWIKIGLYTSSVTVNSFQRCCILSFQWCQLVLFVVSTAVGFDRVSPSHVAWPSIFITKLQQQGKKKTLSSECQKVRFPNSERSGRCQVPSDGERKICIGMIL